MTGWHPPPAELYELIEQMPATVLLESARPATGGVTSDSATRLFIAPLRIAVAYNAEELPRLFVEIEAAVAAGLFAAGYFTYECGSCFEPTAAMHPSRPGDPLAWFGIYDRAHLFDHRTGSFVDGDPPALATLRAFVPLRPSPSELPVAWSLALDEEKYAQRIRAIHELIRAGDIYQLNFTVPLHIHSAGGPAALYRQLRNRQPTPYGAFLHTQPNRRILSFSPELFFRLETQGETRRMTTRPMKGTAPRGRTTVEDSGQAEWLRSDPKNRSENVMIVDLLRNDLGRLCHYGTVRVEDLFAVERYPTLWQMTSTVIGELRSEVDFHHVFRALFPCGSITGAPKIRAMQLLARLEDRPRGVYTGAIGFFSKKLSVFNVAIRTIELDPGLIDGAQGTMGVGSGIVIDSNPAGEFRECLLKAEFLSRAPNGVPDDFSLVETLLWGGEFPLIDLHLDRLEDSAQYFAFPCNRAEATAALLAHASTFLDRESRKVRLLLDSDGALKISDEVLPAPATRSKPLRVRIATQSTDPRNPMLFHKTTHRPVYVEAFRAASEAGYDDVLFLNLSGEVTEGAIHNVFIEKNGRLFTPPIGSGLLAGVYRRHILETHPNAAEKVLDLDDLREGENLYLSNAVRGLRPAVIDWAT